MPTRGSVEAELLDRFHNYAFNQLTIVCPMECADGIAGNRDQRTGQRFPHWQHYGNFQRVPLQINQDRRGGWHLCVDVQWRSGTLTKEDPLLKHILLPPGCNDPVLTELSAAERKRGPGSICASSQYIVHLRLAPCHTLITSH